MQRLLFLLPAAVAAAGAAPPLEIRMAEPARTWASEALPVGNGRLGAMIFGEPDRERIQFNVDSLWTGGANESGGYDIGEFGAYQNFGDLLIESGGEAAPAAGYARVLDLATGIHTVRWQRGGVTYTREAFASHPHQVIAVRFTADQPVRPSGRLRLAGAHGERTTAADGTLAFAGALPNGLRYAAAAAVVNRGGPVTAEGDALVFGGSHELVVLLAAATDHALGEAGGWRSGRDPAAEVRARLAAAAALPWDELRAAHAADHEALMGRVSLDLGAGPAGTTPERIEAVKNGATDTALEALQFQFGRYLLIACSRPGTLPANLQGLWNDSNEPAWFSDYHTNINLQMNYWLAEPANLAECHTPLFDWVEACVPAARRATAEGFGAGSEGWTMRTSVNAFGGNGWQWNLPASAWLSRHFWEHYAFSGDAGFLARRAWPVLRDVSAFWLGHLIERDGKLVVPGGWSPEHGPREDGVAHDQQIVWELFTHTLAAAGAVGGAAAPDPAFVQQVRAARERLLGPRVGSWGQLMEWTTERPELEKSEHRHTSHLYAVYPGHQISTARTPELARAAAVSLEARGSSGDSRRSWTWPWRAALWARLGEADRAHEMVRSLLAFNTTPNLFTTHPPFQIDGNLGITGGVCEMLVQSHAGEVAILPALPKAWPAGSFTGLRARGGITVDAAWQDGRLQSATLRASRDTTVRVRFPGAEPREVRLAANTPQRFPDRK